MSAAAHPYWRLATVGRHRCRRCGELVGRAWVLEVSPVLTTYVFCEPCAEARLAERKAELELEASRPVELNRRKGAPE